MRLIVILFAALLSAAWGRLSHEAVAIVADSQLSPTAKAEIHTLLAIEGHAGIRQITSWADEIRIERRPDAPMHSVRIPLGTHFDAQRDCKKRCAVLAIEQYRKVLADRGRSDAERLEALKYLVHLIADLHQPLHATADGGRQPVAIGRVVSLHKAWDTTLIGIAYRSPERLVRDIPSVPVKSCRSPADWANESNQIATDFVFTALETGVTSHYKSEARRIILTRLGLAAARLACTLNESID